MVATSREQLIADWRERLSAAEASSTDSTTRQAWLLRVRIRLYRFLLSLYGDGDWSASPHQATEPPSVVFDSSDALALEGKPAKGEDRIRAALAAVASAKPNVPELGPLAAGLPPDSWVVAASSKYVWLAREGFQLLMSNGLHPRLRQHGRVTFIEVQAGERSAAFALIGDWRSRARSAPESIRARHENAYSSLVTVVFVVSVMLLAISAAALLWYLISYVPPQSGLTSGQAREVELFFPEYYPAVWLGVLFIWVMAFLAGLRGRWRKRGRSSTSARKALE